MISIVIAEDHSVILDGIKARLRHVPSVVITAIALTSAQALALLKKNTVHVILISDQLPDCAATIKTIRRKYRNVKVLLMALSYAKNTIERSVELEINGIILKDADKKALIKAIETVNEGEEYFDSEVKEIIFEMSRKERARHHSIIKLTPRELEVLRCINAGKNNKEIAAQLLIVLDTVKFHRKNLNSKFDVHHSLALIKKATELGFL